MALSVGAGLLYVAYVVWIGGDFIGSRFLAMPFLVSAVVILHTLQQERWRLRRGHHAAAIAILVVYSLIVPASPLRRVVEPPRAGDVSFYEPASGLSRYRPGETFPFARFLYVKNLEECRAMRAHEFKVAIWGDGLNGFCRGPLFHLIDGNGLTDPLTARLPSIVRGPFLPGHAVRPIPKGYPESILEQRNRIEDPALAEYYDAVRSVASDPLFSAGRWKNIWRLNMTADRRFSEDFPYLEVITPQMRWEVGRRSGGRS